MSAFNGSGTFVISGVGLPYVTGTTISSTVANQFNTDLATALSTCITKDGQTTPTANIPMGGFKITDLDSASADGDALAYNQDAARLTKLGLGMVPTNILDITQTQNAESAASLLNASTGTGGAAVFVARNSTHGGYIRMHSTGFTTAGPNRADGLALGTDGAGGISFSIPSDAFRFYSGGSAIASITVGNTSLPGTVAAVSSGANSGSFVCTGFGVQAILDIHGSIETTSGNGIRMVCVSAGVVLNNGASSWSAISDYRAKNISGALSHSGEIIDAVPVYLGALKDKPEVTKAMFLAHEVQAVVPYAVHGEKDGEKMQTVETTDPLVPIMWEELRQLRARVAALEVLVSP